MRTVSITVTNDDIAHGLRFVSSSCPVARAAQRAFTPPGSVPLRIEVGCEAISVERAAEHQPLPGEGQDRQHLDLPGVVADCPVCRDRLVFALPPRAVKFVGDFDNGYPVLPFTFSAELENAAHPEPVVT